MEITDPPDNLPPSETDIHAYADGVLAAERSERLRHYLGNRSDEARRVVFYSRLNERLKRAFQPADEPVTPRAIRAQGWRTALKRLLTPNSCGVALRTFVVLALAFVALSGWIVALQASDEALSDAAVMALARAPSRYHDATPPAQVAGTDHAAPNLAPARLRLAEKRTVALGPISRISEFVYVNTTGQPVVLLVGLALTAREQTQWAARRVGNIRLLTWVTRHQRYVLAGDANTRGLMQAADMMTLR
jgi:anti-sigma factor RsiW